ncbi:hypothetical protein [Gimesia sp.]|uniref:hypothetical protein n=1 Tax=Gimesia sp. TaxID=2024833 RepID=UPI003A94763E
MQVSQIRIEALSDAFLREEFREPALPEVDVTGNEFTIAIADQSRQIPGETETRKSQFRPGQRTLIGAWKWTGFKTRFRRPFQHNQGEKQQHKSMPGSARLERVEVWLLTEIRSAIKRTFAREQRPRFTYRY